VAAVCGFHGIHGQRTDRIDGRFFDAFGNRGHNGKALANRFLMRKTASNRGQPAILMVWCAIGNEGIPSGEFHNSAEFLLDIARQPDRLKPLGPGSFSAPAGA
jgi:hypothetical protein